MTRVKSRAIGGLTKPFTYTQLPPEVFLTTSADVPQTLTSFPSGFDPEESRASSTAGTMRLCNQPHRRGVCTGASR